VRRRAIRFQKLCSNVIGTLILWHPLGIARLERYGDPASLYTILNSPSGSSPGNDRPSAFTDSGPKRFGT
jgi:hypothetical protein